MEGGRGRQTNLRTIQKDFPNRSFPYRKKYKNSLLQMDSIGFEERSTERHRELFSPGKVEVSLRRKC